MSSVVASFIRDLTYDDLPSSVVEQALRCLLDLTGVAAAGTTTVMSHIAHDHAVENFAGRTHQARLLFDGRTASPSVPPTPVPPRSTASTVTTDTH